MISQSVLERAKRVKLVVMDIDGVMTDGRIIYSIYGDELKFFDVQDGLGVGLLRAAGIPSVIITAKRSRIVSLRARDMRVAKAYQGYTDKLIPFEKMLRRFRVSPEDVCFMGDDVIDLPLLKRVGFAVAVPNAVDEVRAAAHHVTSRTGGRGAVREICDIILRSQGKWDAATAKYAR
jgi:3-deoxy-D-manno-octulosonate 8-phosphate phosphatase (KDO 8-P phosphatase)